MNANSSMPDVNFHGKFLKSIHFYVKIGYESKIKNIMNNDEIIQALKNNPTSNEFISERVKEIVEETVVTDKEKQIKGTL